MGYDLRPKNKDLEPLHCGYSRLFRILKICGYLFTCVVKENGREWVCASGDERMGEEYPEILTNGGFEVTDEEARIMGRMVHNYLLLYEIQGIEGIEVHPNFISTYKAFSEWAPKSGGFSIN